MSSSIHLKLMLFPFLIALASGSASLASARAALHRGRRLWRLRPSSKNRDNPSAKRLDRTSWWTSDAISRLDSASAARKSRPPRTNSRVNSVLRLLQFRSGGLEFGEREGFELAETGLEIRGQGESSTVKEEPFIAAIRSRTQSSLGKRSKKERLPLSEMAHAISISDSETRGTPNERLEALKARNVSTPGNQQQFVDGDLNKIMDRNLYEATKEGDVEKFVDALEKVSESRELALSLIFDQVTPSGNSLLHVAASSGKDDVVELILTHFPYLVTRKNSSDDTPLHVAVQDGRLNVTRKLISRRRDSDIIYRKNKDSKSPLYLAVENCKSPHWIYRKGVGWEILQLLLEASARDEDYAVQIQGMSPVLAAFKDWNSGALREIGDRLPKLLHVRDENGGTLLHSAASIGDYMAVLVLLNKCPDLALQTDKNGSYPIHIACEGNSCETIYTLMEDTWHDLAEIKNNKGQNILHVAAKAGNVDALIIITVHCKDAGIKKLANSKDFDGNTPLHLASMHNQYPVMLYLTRDKRIDLGLLNNDKLTVLDVAMKSGSMSTKYSALLGRAILITAGVPQSKGRDVRSQREQAQWMKDQVNTRLLVATLVATVTFAAGFTLPGGYNASSDPRPGTATMLHNRVFQVFVIANMLAMYSSILAVVVLLGGHISDFYVAEQAYLAAGPLLLMALIGMSVAFLAGITIAVSKLAWLAFLVLSTAVFFLVMLIMVLATLIFPFSKIAMHIMSLYYMLVTLPGYTAQRSRSKYLHDQWQSDI